MIYDVRSMAFRRFLVRNNAASILPTMKNNSISATTSVQIPLGPTGSV